MWSFRALLVLLCSLVTVEPAWCQLPGPKAKGKATPPVTAPKAAPQAPKIDSETLPADYVPPREKDKLLEIIAPIALPDEMDKLKKDDGKFQPALNRALSDDASKTAIRNGIRYRLAQMCLEKNLQTENLKELSRLHLDLLRAINGAGGAARELKPEALKEFRRFVMQEFVKQATPLLENNLYVREQVVIMMGELELVQEDAKKGLLTEAYTPAFDPLVKTILDPKQPESVKLLAVNALTRILKIGTPNVNERTRIAEALIAELARTESHWWYQMRLAGALGSVALDQLKQPIVVTALKGVVIDTKREWSVRTEAAMSLGRVPVPPSSDPVSVVRAVAELALQLAKAVQQQPGDPKWKTEFWKVYLAFRPFNDKDKDAAKAGKAGLLNNAVTAGPAQAPYALIVPMVSTLLKGGPITAAMVSALEAWVKANPPAGAAPNPAPVKPEGPPAQ